MRTALTIAGSDSSGGAGIQADLKTFEAHGVFGMSAITAITAQNTRGVFAVTPLAPDMVIAQIEAVLSDIGADAIKIGMLANAPIAAAVADLLSARTLGPIVLDPVMVSKSGARLLDADAIAVLRDRLIPLAAVVTPNLPETEVLVGRPVRTVADARAAARALVDRGGAHAVLVKGGHLDGDPVDVLCMDSDLIELRAERIETPHTHGTGCTLASAIAARLALGHDLRQAVEGARAYVQEAIRQAPGLGHGHGPLRHKVRTEN